MKTPLKQRLNNMGIKRGIERHNFLIYTILRKQAMSFSYKGQVVDLGCGSSPYKDVILNVADEYIGVDRPGSNYDHSSVDVYADLSKRFPLASRSFDTVVAFQILDDMPEPADFLSECYRILKPKGVLFLTTPFMWGIHEEPHDYYRFTRYGLEYLLKKQKFVDINIDEGEAGFWLMWWLKFNYHTTRFARGPFKYFWYIVWWLTQNLALVLDKLETNTFNREPTHYAVQAHKPQDGTVLP